MIDRDDLEKKDFSICLPEIKSKLFFMATILGSFKKVKYHELLNSPLDCAAVGAFLREISEDIETINTALYPDQEVTA